MPTSYSVEKAKTGRATCRKCKEKIAKDEMRIGTTVVSKDDDGHDVTRYVSLAFLMIVDRMIL